MRRFLVLLAFVLLAPLLGACGSLPGSNSGSPYFERIVDGTPTVKFVPTPATLPAHVDMWWQHPGGDKYKGTVAQGIARFADKVPADVRELLLQEYQTGRAIPTTPSYEGAVTVGEIYPGMCVVRMTFGRGAVVPNVCVNPRDWNSPQWQRASKRVFMYQVTKRTPARYDTYYIYVFEECGNVALVILDTQGDCIKDTLLCDAECQKVKAVTPGVAPFRGS